MSRGIPRILLVIYAVALLLVAFWPTPVDAALAPWLHGWIARINQPWFDYGLIEAAANVALFVPLGLLVTLLLPARLWWLVPLACLAVSALIEGGQGLLLPDRFPSLQDVVANTMGGVIGVTLAALGKIAATDTDDD